MHLPPLRERREDIPLLLEIFVQNILNTEKIEFAGFSEDALQTIYNYNWPGNVRELKNFTETVIVLARGELVTTTMVREHLTHFEDPVEVSTNLPMLAGVTRERSRAGTCL